MAKKYIVTGTHNGKEINETIDNAFSKKQAKLKAGFKNGFGGNSMKRFLDSRSVRVEEI